MFDVVASLVVVCCKLHFDLCLFLALLKIGSHYGGIVSRRCGFTLIEILVTSGIMSVLTVMIFAIMCNVSKIVSLQTDSKEFEKSIVLNDIQAWITDVDSIVWNDMSRNLENQVWFDVGENTKACLPFISHDDCEIGQILVKNGVFGIAWGRRPSSSFFSSKDVFLTKYLVLADNAKDCYLRPLYTEKLFEKKTKTNWEKGDFKKIDSWNNNKKIHLSYDNIKKLQEMKKKGEIAGVQLVIEKK